MGIFNRIKIQNPFKINKGINSLPYSASYDVIKHYENQGLNAFDELFDSTFGCDIGEKKYIQLASDTDIIDTILRYIAGWFSMGVPYELDSNGNVVEDGDLTKLLLNPNKYQGKEEFLNQFVYYLLASGTNYVFVDTDFEGFEKDPESVELKNLNFDNVILPKDCNSILPDNKDFQFKYRENNAGIYKETFINFSEVIAFYDSVNAVNGNYFMGSSRLESLKDEIQNIRLATKAKQNQLNLSGIVLVTPESDNTEGTMSEGLDSRLDAKQTHKQHIESKFSSSGLTKGRSIVVSSRQLKVMNLTEPLSKLDFDIGKIESIRAVKRKFGIHKDLLPLTEKGSTYENQQQAELAIIQNVITPIANNLTSSISNYFDTGNTLHLDYKHLSQFSVSEKKKSEMEQKHIEIASSLVENGFANIEEAKNYLKEKGFNL